jgi:hypothetical protein
VLGTALKESSCVMSLSTAGVSNRNYRSYRKVMKQVKSMEGIVTVYIILLAAEVTVKMLRKSFIFEFR